jgi:hypothetical protein
MNTLTTHETQFEEPGSWRHRKIESLSDSFKSNFYNLQKEFDKIDEYLTQGKNKIKSFDEIKEKVSEKCKQVLSYTRKVLSVQKRILVSLEIKQEFERKVGKYLKDFIKLCEYGNFADQFHQVPAPASFLNDFLEMCSERLSDMEDHILIIEEMVKNECETECLAMLIQTISLMQEKFKIVSAATYEAHAKVSKMFSSLSTQYKELKNYTPFNDHKSEHFMTKHNNDFDRNDAQTAKENTPVYAKPSNIKDVISGRLSYSNR